MIKRPAFTLAELVVTMSAGSTLMVLAIGMIHQTMRLASTARQHANNDRSINRLVDQFRHDVHRADQITVESSKMIRIDFASADEVTYRVSGDGVVRQQRVTGGEYRETYQLTANREVTFAIEPDPLLRAVLTVQRETGLQGVAPRMDRLVESVVGRLRSHESAQESAP